MKYFVLGALSSGLLLYGMSMIYGATGTLSIPDVAASVGALASRDHNFLAFGLVFVVAGVAFKLAWCLSTCGFPTSTTARRPR